MRPSRYSRSLPVAAAMWFLLMSTRGAAAQSPTATEGAVFLLLPVGARAVGMGEAAAASRTASEALWWNPAGLGAASRREAAVHHSQSFVGIADAVSVIFPSSLLGVLAVAFNILDYGDQEIRDNQQNLLGTLLPRSIVVGLTYGTTLTAGATAGVTVKRVELRVDCSGSCQAVPTFSAPTTAVDFGFEYDFRSRLPLTIGVAVRNLGPSLQVNDSPQSDPLPRRIMIGAEYRFVPPPNIAVDTDVRVALDVLDEFGLGNPVARVGAELAWQKRGFVRAGYVGRSKKSESGGPSVGLGYDNGRLQVDLARVFSGFSADAGQAPIHLSLRLQF